MIKIDMEEKTQNEKIANYLDYMASKVIQLSNYYKEGGPEDNTIILQHLNEMAESLGSIMNIIPREEGDFESDVKETLRDFKIGQIMNGRN